MKRAFYATLGVVVALASCSEEPDDPIIPHEEEVITTLNYQLTPMGGGATVTFSFQDLDGDGGNDPVITSGTLQANTSYTASLELLNELEDPAEDITVEVQGEGDEHQFFFISTSDSLDISYADLDENGNPIGLNSLVETSGVSTGTLTIVLRHEPVKDAAGVSDGDITNAGGESDIEVTFDLNIEQ